MKRLSPTPETVHFGFYDATLKPVLEVDSGEILSVGTVSADPNDAVPAEWLPENLHEIYRSAPRGTGPHILTGPVWVRSA